jgi:hypothetical protein
MSDIMYITFNLPKNIMVTKRKFFSKSTNTNTMSEEPQFPPIPSMGEEIKKNMIEKKTSILKCDNCGRSAKRPFEAGDYVFAKIENGKSCPQCSNTNYTIMQIHGEWVKSSRKERKNLL